MEDLNRATNEVQDNTHFSWFQDYEGKSVLWLAMGYYGRTPSTS